MVRRQVSSRSVKNRGSRNLREATPSDASFVAELSGEVFSQFGDYGSFLPAYLDHPAIFSTVLEEGDLPLGFSMLALVRGEPLPDQLSAPLRQQPAASSAEGPLDLELLAIAVRPDWQGKGVGKQLIGHALRFAVSWHQTSGVRALQLNVAETNRRAFAFFSGWGFQVIDPDDGTYPNGQRSLRMMLLLAEAKQRKLP